MRRALSALLLATLSLAVQIEPAPINDELVTLFREWKLEHNKHYPSSLVEREALEAFAFSFAEVEYLNSLHANGDPEAARFKLNHRSDLPPNHRAARRSGYLPTLRSQSTPIAPRYELGNASKAFSWIGTGALTPIKDQGDCGSCWAFSATETLESMTYLATGMLPVLAPQQLVDCDEDDNHCHGGDVTVAMAYQIEYGQELNATYPYTGNYTNKTSCQYKPHEIASKPLGWMYAIPPCENSCNEQDIVGLAAALTRNPISVCVDGEFFF